MRAPDTGVSVAPDSGTSALRQPMPVARNLATRASGRWQHPPTPRRWTGCVVALPGPRTRLPAWLQLRQAAAIPLAVTTTEDRSPRLSYGTARNADIKSASSRPAYPRHQAICPSGGEKTHLDQVAAAVGPGYAHRQASGSSVNLPFSSISANTGMLVNASGDLLVSSMLLPFPVAPGAPISMNRSWYSAA
jgi:hypothetical protein